MQVLHTVLIYISYGTFEDNFCNNQELPKFTIVLFILMTSMSASWVILLGERLLAYYLLGLRI